MCGSTDHLWVYDAVKGISHDQCHRFIFMIKLTQEIKTKLTVIVKNPKIKVLDDPKRMGYWHHAIVKSMQR